MSRNLSRTPAVIAAACIAAYFVYFTAGSLRTEFTHDDLMNGYRGWSYPLSSLLADNVLFFRVSPMYRPLGALVYKIFFLPFGFDLFPLRLFLWMTLAANVVLIYHLARMLTGSQEAGLFAAFVSSYHMKLGQLYYDSGTLYDILCFFFYFSALLFYIHIRRQRKNLGALQVATLCALYILALNSKEVAVSLPVALLGYELLWHPPVRKARALRVWLEHQSAVWITIAITAAFIFGRVLDQERSISTVGDYTMTISATEYFSKMAFYLNEVFYTREALSPSASAIVMLGVLAAGVAARSRGLLFGLLLWLGGILPMAFIHARSLSAVYLPMAGLTICTAVLLEFVCEGTRSAVLRPAWRGAVFSVVFGLLGLFLIWVHPSNERMYVAQSQEYDQIRDARERLRQLHPQFPYASRILIVGTPFPQYSPGYNNMFLIRLAYRDKSLVVDELARYEENHQTPDLDSYDYVLSWEDGRWIDIDRATLANKLTSQ